MKYPITVKRGPLSLIKNIILVEIFAGFLLVLSVYIANYQEILSRTLAQFIRYDYSLVLAASLFQLFITFVVFLRWLNENYEIREKEIIRKKGIFSVIQKSFPLKEIKEVVLRQNLLERLTNCGTVIVRDNQSKKVLSMRNIENPEIITETLKAWRKRSTLPRPKKIRRCRFLIWFWQERAKTSSLKKVSAGTKKEKWLTKIWRKRR